MKQQDFRFEYQNLLRQEDEQVIFEGINEDAAEKKNMLPVLSFGIFIKDLHNTVVGGITGVTMYGCLYIDMLWIKKTLQRQGLGSKLMQDAESIGHDRGCHFATVNTMDWEALRFYQKLGFVVEFVREGYDLESKMYMLRKKL